MHHVMAVGRPLDRRTGRPADNAPRAAFAWGRGSEGQLGTKAFDDSPAPLLVEGLKGRSLLQASGCGCVLSCTRACSGLPIAVLPAPSSTAQHMSPHILAMPCSCAAGHVRRQQQHGGV